VNPVLQIVAENGAVRIRETEPAELKAGFARVRTMFSAISSGTESMLISEGRTKPGIQVLGYQAAGIIEQVGSTLENEFHPRQFVACYGSPYVSHSSALDVPKHLFCRIPEGLELREAAFAGLGTIALHAIRCANLQLGETVVIIGLGVLGNLVAQLAASAGCSVYGCDRVASRRHIAQLCGISAYKSIAEITETILADGTEGADAVFLAIGGCDDTLVQEVTTIIRTKGKVVIVGTTNAQIPREQLFKKEAELLVSRAGGPGRYDPRYEADGIDYPYGYVRWTEHRNLQEFVRQLALGRVNVKPIITTMRLPRDAAGIYSEMHANPEDHLGVVFDWNLQK
jgi:threonine dehydrogenase-like Zn-dependent dehydrogenase